MVNRSRSLLPATLLVVGLGCGGTEPMALRENLGRHHYPVNASPRAQAFFDQGVRLLWAFNHAEAGRSFREGERLDSRCAMCSFGVALAAGPNINAPMTGAGADTAAAAIRRAQSRATVPAERRLIDALAARYAAPDPAGRAQLDTAYADGMRGVVAEAPDDLEARILFADALMNLSPWNYWNADGSPRPATPEILAQLDTVLARNPDHPGACHLFIHAVEARDPARAVACAERLAALMPGAGHIVHMPGHVYIRVGRYADAVELNKHAVHADQTFLEGPQALQRGIYPSGYYPHNHHFLSFAASMMGASALAIEHAFEAAKDVDPSVAAEIPWIEAITPVGFWTLVTFGQWDRILAEKTPPPGQRFATGMAFFARGTAFAAKQQWNDAAAALDSVKRIAAVFPEGDNKTALRIAELALAGEVALRRGTVVEAVTFFRAGAQLEDGMAYNEPPVWPYPMRHSLGKALVLAGRFPEAERVYREDLERFPENGWSLYGLAQALNGMKRFAEEKVVRERFDRAWAHADVQLTSSRF